MTTPPVDQALVSRYWTGTLTRSEAVAVEHQLQRSPVWRDAVNRGADTARMTRNFDAIAAEVDAPRRGRIERGLTRVGVPEHIVRVMGATPIMRRAWLVASVLALLFGLAAANGERSAGDLTLLLALAPLVPVIGVGLAYGPGVDPAHEMTVVAPISGFRLLLLRAATVVGITVVLGGVASVFTADRGLIAAAWLIPALALCTATLGLSTWIPTRLAAAFVGATWLAVVIGFNSATDDAQQMFGPVGQIVSAVTAVAAGAVLYARRDAFDTLRATES